MKKIFIVLTAIVLYSFYGLPQAYASYFDDLYLRLDNQNANSALSGTVCAKPSSPAGATESKVKISFPSDFTISQNPSNWSTNTNNLASGDTIWPGIGITATAVSGQTVTFASGNLTSSSIYCFNFTAGSSTTGSAGNKTGTVSTENSSNTIIDQTVYAVAIVNDNQISITASVPPSVSDLPIEIEALTSGSAFPQDTVLSYRITYGSTTAGSNPLTIQAQWSQGTIQGSPAPSVDLLDYVIGSATNAYNSTPPVINIVNRTIAWTINSIPGNTTGQTVTFSLKTNDSYTGESNVSFDVSAWAFSGPTVTPDVSVTQNYLYSATLSTPTPTPTSAPSASSAPSATLTPQASPTTTPAVQPLAFLDISIRSISQSEAKIVAATNRNAVLTIQYGTSPNSLTKAISTLTPKTQNLLTLPDLSPDTDYYFKITAKDSNGKQLASDIFTFRTALISETPLVNKQTLIVTSQSNILLNPTIAEATGKAQANALMIPVSTVFEIQFSLKKHVLIRSIQIIIRSKYVLGFNTMMQTAEASSNLIDLVETRPGVYTGRVKSLPIPGEYELYIRIIDFNGNISEQKITDLIVSRKFSIFEKGTNFPVENARVFLYLYNEKTRVYKIISPEVLPVNNPSHSIADGTLPLALPFGRYKADISSIGYKNQAVDFQIGPQSDGYPIVFLEKEPFSAFNWIKYYGTAFTDYLRLSGDYLKARSDSSRLFDLLTLSAMTMFILSAFVSFSARTHIPLFYIPYFFIYKLKLIFLRNKSSLIFGTIANEEGKDKISRANVYLIDAVTNAVISHTKTNKLGEFYFKKTQAEDYKISVMKNGFSSSPFYEYTNKSIGVMPITINIKKDVTKITAAKEILSIYIEDVFGIMLESLLLIAIILEIYFVFAFGFLKIAPFLALSTSNVLLLLVFLYRPRKLGEITPIKN